MSKVRRYQLVALGPATDRFWDELEAGRFLTAYPAKPMIPLQYTGGASRLVVAELGEGSNPDWRILEHEQDATSMLRYRRLLNAALAYI